MKKLLLIALFISGIINAQNKGEYTHSLKGIKKVRIEGNSSIIVLSKKTSNLLIKDNAFNHKGCDDCSAMHEHTHTKTIKDKTKGLTAIYPGGKDNTNGMGFSVYKDGTTLIVKDLKSQFQRHGVQIELPNNLNLSIDTGNLGGAEIIGFTSEVEINTNVGRISMKDVTGPITAHSNVGNISIDFTKVSQASPITVSSSTSEIDVTMPSNTKADLDLKTNGTVYTNFNIEIPTPKPGMRNVSGIKKIVSSLNNGGVKIKLKSSMGNIYLRKK